MTSSDIEGMAARFYAMGEDPIDYAAGIVTEFISMHHALQQAASEGVRVRGVSSRHAAYGPGEDIGPLSLGRRVVGYLLDAGWTPPAPEAVAAAAERARIKEQEVLAHRLDPCTTAGCGHPLTDHVGPPGGSCTRCEGCWSWNWKEPA